MFTKGVTMKITKHHRNLLLAMSLGDGHITKPQKYSHSPQLRIEHAETQLEYLEWKFKLLPKKWRTYTRQRIKDYAYKGISKNLVSYWSCTCSLKELRLLRRVLYGKTRNKKIITPKMLERVGKFGIMIWYMDDGNLLDRGKTRGYQLRIYSFQTKEENQKLIDFFKNVYGINFYQSKRNGKYILECGSFNAKRFIGLFSEFEKPECMQYKFDVVDSKYNKYTDYYRKRALLYKTGEDIV
jgi:hypothetical protein